MHGLVKHIEHIILVHYVVPDLFVVFLQHEQFPILHIFEFFTIHGLFKSQKLLQ